MSLEQRNGDLILIGLQREAELHGASDWTAYKSPIALSCDGSGCRWLALDRCTGHQSTSSVQRYNPDACLQKYNSRPGLQSTIRIPACLQLQDAKVLFPS
jgi:hypothetical protein